MPHASNCFARPRRTGQITMAPSTNVLSHMLIKCLTTYRHFQLITHATVRVVLKHSFSREPSGTMRNINNFELEMFQTLIGTLRFILSGFEECHSPSDCLPTLGGRTKISPEVFRR